MKEKSKRDNNDKGINIENIQIVNPLKDKKTEEYAKALYELRKSKGMTEEQAHQLILDPVYFGMMMVKLNEADGLVSEQHTQRQIHLDQLYKY